MQRFYSPIVLVASIASILVLTAIVVAWRTRSTSRRSRGGTLLAASPALVMVVLFYSLALHMHHTLGGWPSAIGEAGFPPWLITHSHIAAWLLEILVLLAMFAWPLVLLLCLMVRRWRGFVYYLAVYAVSCLVCFGLLSLAPAPFLNWWWD